MRKNNSGFLLIEAAIFILILGISLTTLSAIYSTVRRSYEISITKQHTDVVMRMLGAYLIKHGCLPNAAAKNSGLQSQGLTYGFVPYKTLGLPKNSALDGSGKPIMYMVSSPFTTSSRIRSDSNSLDMGESVSFCEIEESEISVIDSTGSSTSNSPICFVLIPSEVHQQNGFSPGHVLRDNSSIRWVSKDELVTIYAHTHCST